MPPQLLRSYKWHNSRKWLVKRTYKWWGGDIWRIHIHIHCWNADFKLWTSNCHVSKRKIASVINARLKLLGQGITALLPPLPVGAIYKLKNTSVFSGHFWFSGLKLSVPDTICKFKWKYWHHQSRKMCFFYSSVFLGAKSGKDEKLNSLDKLQKALDKQDVQARVFLFILYCFC